MKTRYEDGYINGKGVKPATIDEMIGVEMVSVVHNMERGELVFTDTYGTRYIFYHEQDCCESVSIDDICGDLNDLTGTPLVQAECVSNDGGDYRPDEYTDSWTWTFYKFATMKGYVTVKWLGVSNGYYSEGVSFRIEEP